MSGVRSERHRQEKNARDTYNNRKRSSVSDRDVEKDKKVSEQYGGDNNVTGDDPRKTRKMKTLWIILLLIIAGGLFLAAYKINKNRKAASDIADDPRIERTVTPTGR